MLSLQPDESLLQAVAQFNRSGSEYRVELASYFPSYRNVTQDEWDTAAQKFNVELISGKVPEILSI